ncbi:GlsB/YeaQ/YmgE family stress response membrane protein [Pseudonocardia sp. HH130630-07]|uniref:GlsB/YeaQ/YmgE family stress response membrane protein n=1 Tax=Pseudonocardia sp. HH130630-07 TaxID=1690815 RepID=UPI000815161B|nr:GlsB/YeaQ/YmgE family stress response membrane protein [Pseudonocardia sp. HH130630-07]ANY05209.1 hypothetical protein AFB00_01525 [Pseudonocardia sp. HH130630-07]
MWSLIVTIVVGLVAGFIARAVVPGKDSMGVIATILLGIAGSFVGGFLWTLITTGTLALTTSGFIGSILGAIVVLLAYNAVTGRKKVRR